MARSDRLLRLLHAIRVMKAPITAARLAEATRTSLRSIYRDIDSLRAAGARIEGERGYGYRLIEDDALPPQTFDRIEIEALVLGLAEVSRIGDPTLSQASASVLAKIAASLPSEREQYLVHAISQIYRPNARMPAPLQLDVIRDACWREESLGIRYTDLKGATTERTILPLAVVYSERMVVVLAWCNMREAFRMFSAERIVVTEPRGRSFRPKRASLLRTYLDELRSRPDAKVSLQS